MPHDPELVAETRAWLGKAEKDIGMGAAVLAAEPSYPSGAAFHAQQAAEKSMKGLLTWHNHPFPKTHDLANVGHRCVAVDPTLDPLLRRAALLTEYAWKFRYPGDPEEATPEEAREALQIAREVYAAIIARLPEEVAP